jgi:hypothetical protein
MYRVKALLAALLAFACLTLLYAQSPDLPSGPVQTKMNTACLECHDARIIVQQRLSKAAWTKEIDKMIRWGAVVDPADREAFIDYLSSNFPEGNKPYVAGRTAKTSKK